MIFTIDDLAAALEVPAGEISEPRFRLMMDEVEVLVRSYRPALPDDTSQWPKVAVVVSMRVMQRGYSLDAPTGATAQMIVAGSWTKQTQYSSESAGGTLYLTKADRLLLRGRGRAAYGVDLMPTDRPVRDVIGRPDEWSPR